MGDDPGSSPELGRMLVTGANGHLGRRLLRHVAELPGPPPLRALVRSERAAETLRSLGAAPAPEVVVADYADADAVARAVDGCRNVVHLVGILKQTREARYADAHERASATLARAAAKAGVRRIVYLSILGARPDHPNPCLASKGRAERLLLEGSVPTTVLCVPMVLGPGELAAAALRARAQARRVALIRGGASLEQPLDARDVVAAILAALADPGAGSRRLELAGPESLPQRELVARAAALLGRSRPRVLPIPRGLAWLAAALAERLRADPPVTRAMLEVLDHDDCIDPEPARAALGIRLTPLHETLRWSLLGDESGGAGAA